MANDPLKEDDYIRATAVLFDGQDETHPRFKFAKKISDLFYKHSIASYSELGFITLDLSSLISKRHEMGEFGGSAAFEGHAVRLVVVQDTVKEDSRFQAALVVERTYQILWRVVCGDSVPTEGSAMANFRRKMRAEGVKRVKGLLAKNK